jgi:hypothetical protein
MADSKISALTAHTSVSDSDELVIVDNSGTATSKKITKKNLVKNIVNVDVASSAAIDFSKLAALNSARILVGNGSNVATSVAMSGDVAIDNAGATTIQTNAVDDAMLSGSITPSKVTGTAAILGANAFTADQDLAGNNISNTNYQDFDKITAPADPSANHGRVYVKQIDSNNDGIFIKIKKGGSFVEVQIA